MISSYEVRAGNLFYWNGEVLPSYEIIFHPGKKEVVEITPFILGQLLSYRPGKNFNKLNIEPIILTPEILTDWCGLIALPDKVDCYAIPIQKGYEAYQFGIDHKIGSDVIVCAKGSMGWAVSAKYLHQLQNIVFILYGSELEIKIPQKA